MVVLDVKWFNGRTTVGIVKVMTDVTSIKYYIGASTSLDKIKDAQYIADWGCEFPRDIGNDLFNND